MEPIEAEEVRDLLASLVERSLVMYDECDGGARYHLLETVREYARNRLVESGESERIRRAHLDYFAALGTRFCDGVEATGTGVWLDLLEPEMDNLSTALAVGRDLPDRRETALAFASDLQRLWELRGHFTQGRKELEAVLELNPEPGIERANALRSLAAITRNQGDSWASIQAGAESVRICRLLGDRKGEAASLTNVGVAYYDRGNFAEARAHFEEALAITRDLGGAARIAILLNNIGALARELGDTEAARRNFEESLPLLRDSGSPVMLANTLSNLGSVEHDCGELAAARDHYEESLALREGVGDTGGAVISRINLGLLAVDEGDLETAEAYLRKALVVLRETGDRRMMAYGLEGFARLAEKRGDLLRFARIWGAAEALRYATGAPLPPNERQSMEPRVAAARAEAGETAFDEARSDARAMSVEEAAAYALEEP